MTGPSRIPRHAARPGPRDAPAAQAGGAPHSDPRPRAPAPVAPLRRPRRLRGPDQRLTGRLDGMVSSYLDAVHLDPTARRRDKVRTSASSATTTSASAVVPNRLLEKPLAASRTVSSPGVDRQQVAADLRHQVEDLDPGGRATCSARASYSGSCRSAPATSSRTTSTSTARASTSSTPSSPRSTTGRTSSSATTPRSSRRRSTSGRSWVAYASTRTSPRTSTRP
jgi:hypothetical protein